MTIVDHVRFTGAALKAWLVAQVEDSLAVGALWWVGLHFIQVPLTTLWALLAAVLQIVPHIGPALALIGPLLAASLAWRDWRHPLLVLALYALIAALDGFFLQPFIMKRTAKVPIWASILAPVVLGYLIPFWGVLFAPPLLAVIFAYRAKNKAP